MQMWPLTFVLNSSYTYSFKCHWRTVKEEDYIPPMITCKQLLLQIQMVAMNACMFVRHWASVHIILKTKTV